MTQLYSILKASKLGAGAAPNMYTALLAQKINKGGSGGEAELSGVPPLTFPADGTPLIDCLISGNATQSGTPTPDNPIMPEGTGERTGNLFDSSTLANDYTLNATTGLPYSFPKRIATLTPIDVSTLTSVTLSYQSEITNTMFIYAVLNGSTLVSRVASNHSGDTIDVSGGNKLYISFYSQPDNITTDKMSNITLNTGSTAPPYEPYGYKIGILSANTTTPVYLGEVETTRKIGKAVFKGDETENWGYSSSGNNARVFLPVNSMGASPSVSTHYRFEAIRTYPNLNEYCINNASALVIGVDINNITSAADFKAYLAQQYSAGTPVTVWYVLATEETGIVNEPLCKIGDYADTLSKEQAGVQIPTNRGNTVIDVLTELKPSEVYIKYHTR